MPYGLAVSEINERACRAVCANHQAVRFKVDALVSIVAVTSATIFNMPDIHPGKVISTVANVVSRTDDHRLALLKLEHDALLLRLGVHNENSQVLAAVSVEVSSPYKGIQASRNLER
jgi:hypothetical protein